MNSWGNEQHSDYVKRSDRASFKRKAYVYGSSVLGSPLQAYLPEAWSDNRTLILAGLHGEEPETSNVLSYVLRSIEPNALRCAVIITANPDGMIAGTRGNSNNVDLNRNFPTPDWQGGITTTCWEMDLPKDVELTSGNKPASESEVNYLLQCIQDQHIQQIVSIHAPMACIDYEQDDTWPLVQHLSRQLDLPIVNDIGYPCPGSMDRWATYKHIRLVTLEIEASLPLSKIREKYGPVLQDLLLAKAPSV